MGHNAFWSTTSYHTPPIQSYMTNLFKKAAVCSDSHFGAKSNSTIHNEDCLNFFRWFVQNAKEHGCEICIFLGDYHNNRATMNIKTMQYALKGLELLDENFQHVYYIPGNHDLFFKDTRDANSTPWAKHLKNVTVIEDFLDVGGCTFAPWLVGDDYKKIKTMSGKYMFGHFELPGYMLNSMVEMPDHGEISKNDFYAYKHVFSGHFHQRQTKNNVTYIGNCFPHNYSDAGDDNRGMMILEWDKPPVFEAWPDQPVYRVYNLSDVLNNTESLLRENMHCRINIDIDISYEEASFIKDTFRETYNLREITLLPQKSTDVAEYDLHGNVQFESVDQIVSACINTLESKNFISAILLEIYRDL